MTRALKMREPLPGVKELGIACFHCHAFTHQYYETDAMRAAHPVKPEDRETYRELYDAEQVRVKGLIDEIKSG
jgi:hypothetical protein